MPLIRGFSSQDEESQLPRTGTTITVGKPTWWLIPLSKWVITPVINGISRVNPLITGVITHLLSGMSHQVLKLRKNKHTITNQAWEKDSLVLNFQFV